MVPIQQVCIIVVLSILLTQHNVPMSLADHLSPLIRDVFDGEVAKRYACARTKTTCVLNGAIAPEFKAELIAVMQQVPYSLSVDGSNDTGLEKLNPLTVRIYDEKWQKRFLDMCTTTGKDAAEAIFEKINAVLSAHAIPWSTV